MNKYISEFIGTFVLVFVGTGAIIANDASLGAITHVGISLTFGFAVLAMIYTIGDISGAHINPAVSFAFFLSGRLSLKDTFGYSTAQVLGALIASFSLLLLMPAHATLGATLPTVTPLKAFVFEVILTYILVFVISRVASGAKEKGFMAGVAIGCTVALAALFAGPITGASMNPARSIGPALAAGRLEHLWLYIVAPMLGAALAVLSLKMIGLECCPDSQTCDNSIVADPDCIANGLRRQV